MDKTRIPVKVPLGFRFDPTDEELLKHYLARKIAGQELPPYDIPCIEVYGNMAPWEIFGESTKEKIYVFTKLKKASHKRIARVAGCGTWYFDKKIVEIYDGNKKNVIGFKKIFSFKVKGKGKKGKGRKIKGQWIMHEFSLAGDSGNKINGYADYVICRIYNKRFNDEDNYEVDHSTADECVINNIPQNQEYCDDLWVHDLESVLEEVSMLDEPSALPHLDLSDIGEWNHMLEDYFSDSNYNVQQQPVLPRSSDESGLSMLEEYLMSDESEPALPSFEDNITGDFSLNFTFEEVFMNDEQLTNQDNGVELPTSTSPIYHHPCMLPSMHRLLSYA